MAPFSNSTSARRKKNRRGKNATVTATPTTHSRRKRMMLCLGGVVLVLVWVQMMSGSGSGSGSGEFNLKSLFLQSIMTLDPVVPEVQVQKELPPNHHHTNKTIVITDNDNTSLSLSPTPPVAANSSTTVADSGSGLRGSSSSKQEPDHTAVDDHVTVVLPNPAGSPGLECEQAQWLGKAETNTACYHRMVANQNCGKRYLTYNTRNQGCACYPTHMAVCTIRRANSGRISWDLTISKEYLLTTKKHSFSNEIAAKVKVNDTPSSEKETTMSTRSTRLKDIETLQTHLRSNNNTIVQRRGRRDRLGSNIQRPMLLMLFSYCAGYNFCIVPGRQLLASEFSFPICTGTALGEYGGTLSFRGSYDNWIIKKNTANNTSSNNESNHNASSPSTTNSVFFNFDNNDKFLTRIYSNAELQQLCQANHPDDFLTVFHKAWQAMVIGAQEQLEQQQQQQQQPSIATSGQEEEHSQTNGSSSDSPNQQDSSSITTATSSMEDINKKKVTTIAVHIRRGDISKDNRNDIFMEDTIFVQALVLLRDMVHQVYPTRPPHVHLFSEDYGMVNWTSYDDVVDVFSLAPEMRRMNLSLNLKHWRAFVEADIFLSSGTSFAQIPCLGRLPANPTTGLPLTLIVNQANKPMKFPYQNYSALVVERRPIPTVVDMLGLPTVWESVYPSVWESVYQNNLPRYNNNNTKPSPTIQ